MQRPAKAIDIFLQPGEYFVGDAQFRIRTLLGSCVSMTLWHPGRKIGAMSHFLLGRRSRDPGAAPDGRYGEEALALMLAEFQRVKLNPAECEAKIIGGGNMFPNQTRSAALHVGQKNGELARSLLQEHGIPVVSENLFGNGHRQVVFDVWTGHVWVRQVEPVAQPERAPDARTQARAPTTALTPGTGTP